MLSLCPFLLRVTCFAVILFKLSVSFTYFGTLTKMHAKEQQQAGLVAMEHRPLPEVLMENNFLAFLCLSRH